MTIEDNLGLHSRVEIIYVVDGYEASLIGENEETIETGFGESIFNALLDLDERLKK